jgi:hypothetical protein
MNSNVTTKNETEPQEAMKRSGSQKRQRKNTSVSLTADELLKLEALVQAS